MNVQLYQGDCLDFMKTLPDGSVDAVVTDPPYNIDHVLPWQKNNGYDRFPTMQGNDSEFDPRPFLGFPTVVLWGANNYTEHLPRGGWICWDKRCSESADKMFGSPFELAWINNCKVYKMARIQHGGAVNADGRGVTREHPTQKPILLMQRCLELAKIPEGATVFDPFMGSGTTGVACVQTGRNFIGCEIDPTYFEIAQRRIEEAQMQGVLL